jgi:hypothetical protein
MIGRKLAVVRNGQTIRIQHTHPFVPELQKIKNLTLKNIKKIGYVTIFVTFRFFIKSSNLVKTRSNMYVKELKNRFKGNKKASSEEIIEGKEVSKYLKIISEYQKKIRKIRHMIKEEEGIK